jgi:hypothetical protein
MNQKAYERNDKDDQTRSRRHKLVPMQGMQELRVVRHTLGRTQNVGNTGEGRLPQLCL